VADQVFYQVFPDRFARGGDGPVALPPELRRGAFMELAAEGELYAFARFDAGAATVIAVNRGSKAATLRPALPTLPNGVALPAAQAVPARGSSVWCSR
jgi:hypothetical protein